MALFNKEQDRNARPEPPRIQSQPEPQAAVAPPMPPTPIVASATPATSMRPALSPASASGAYLDNGSKISGKLSFDTPIKIDGQVDGEIIAKDSLTIGESAVVTAQIKASSIIVAGKVSGDISATNRIEIRRSAKVVGNLAAPILVVHEGASFEGHCSMSPEGARDDRKVTIFPKEERTAQKLA